MNPLSHALGRELRQRGPERRAAPAWVADNPNLRILIYAAAAFLTALVANLLVVGEQDPQAVGHRHPRVASDQWNGQLRWRGPASGSVFAARCLPRSVRFVVASAVVILLAWMMVNLVVGNIGKIVTRAPFYEQNLRNTANLVNGWLGLEELSQEQPLFEMGRITAMVRSLARSMTGVLGST